MNEETFEEYINNIYGRTYTGNSQFPSPFNPGSFFSYHIVKIEFFHQGQRITQIVPLTDEDIARISDRTSRHTASERESFRKRWEAEDKAEYERNRPRFNPNASAYGQESFFPDREQQRHEQERLRKEREEKIRQARAKAERDRSRQEESRRIWENLNEEFARLKEQADRLGGPSIQQARRIRLATIAGVEWPTEIEDKKLLRRAQRKAHPDTGGSHELWLEVDKLRVSMGL